MAQILGIKVQRGRSSKTQKDYSIITATYVQPVQDVDKENLSIKFFGLNVVTRQMGYMDSDDTTAFVNRIKHIKYPCEGQLVTEEREFDGKFESVLTNIIFSAPSVKE